MPCSIITDTVPLRGRTDFFTRISCDSRPSPCRRNSDSSNSATLKGRPMPSATTRPSAGNSTSRWAGVTSNIPPRPTRSTILSPSTAWSSTRPTVICNTASRFLPRVCRRFWRQCRPISTRAWATAGASASISRLPTPFIPSHSLTSKATGPTPIISRSVRKATAIRGKASASPTSTIPGDSTRR